MTVIAYRCRQVAGSDGVGQSYRLIQRSDDRAQDQSRHRQPQQNDQAADQTDSHIGLRLACFAIGNRTLAALLLQLHKLALRIHVDLGVGTQLFFNQIEGRRKIIVLARGLHGCIALQRRAPALGDLVQHLARFIVSDQFVELFLQLGDMRNPVTHQLALLLHQVFLGGNGRDDGAIHTLLGQMTPLTGNVGCHSGTRGLLGDAHVHAVQIDQAACRHQQQARQQANHQSPQLL